MAKRKSEDIIPENTSKIPKKRLLRSTMAKCNVCDEDILSPNDSECIIILCKECHFHFHGACVGIPTPFMQRIVEEGEGWACYTCIQNKMQFVQKLEDKVFDMEKSIRTNTGKITNIQASCEAALQTMETKIVNLRTEFQSDLKSVQSTRSISPSQSVSNSSSNASSNSELERKNNLVFQNIPVAPNETPEMLKEMIIKIAATLGYVCHPTYILFINRMRGRIIPPVDRNGPLIISRPPSKSIMVKFADVTIKDAIFENYLALVNINSFITGINAGLGFPDRIYINHHLSGYQTKIKIAATKLKSEGKVQKVNANYDGVSVYVNNDWHLVTSLDQLTQLSSN